MKEILAENRTKLTKDLVYEGTLRVWNERIGKGVDLLLLLLCLLWFGLFVYTLTRGGGRLPLILELLALGFVVLWAHFLMPRRSAARIWRGMEASGLAEAERTLRFYRDSLEVEQDGSSSVYAYREIALVMQSGRTIILLPEKLGAILVDKAGFTNGAAETVLQAIEEAKKEDDIHD